MKLREGRGLRASLLKICLSSALIPLALPDPLRGGGKSLRLYEDHPVPGTSVSVRGRRSRAEDSAVRPFEGVSCLRVQLDREEDAEFRMEIARAWVSAGEAYPGDLSALRPEGALAFWVRAPGGLQGIEIGFEESPSESVVDLARRMGLSAEEALEVEPRVSLSLADYARGTEGWERVVIPLRDFGRGFYLWMEPDDAGGVGGRVVRRDYGYHWKSTGAFFLMAPAFHSVVTTLELDKIELVPRFKPDEVERRKHKVEESRRRLAGAPPDLLIFGDRPLSPLWAYGGRQAEVVVDQTVSREGKASALFRMTSRNSGTVRHAPSRKGVARPVTVNTNLAVETQDSWAGLTLPETDLRAFVPHGAVSFWVRGKNGGEGFTLTLGSRLEGVEVVTAESPDIRHYGDISGEWRRAYVPLVDFSREGGFSWGRVVELGFHAPPTDEMELAWWLDDIRFVGEGDFEGVKTQPVPSGDGRGRKGGKPWIR